jgi:hypothetical protein
MSSCSSSLISSYQNTMPAKQATHTNKKLIIVICGIISQYLTFHFNLGIVSGILAFIASCGAFAAVHFSDREAIYGEGKVNSPVSRSL